MRLCSEAGNNGEEVDLSRSVHLSEHDEARLVADMQSSRTVIAEVALDPGSGLWVYMGLRPDKDRPNFITTVISTMVEVGQSVRRARRGVWYIPGTGKYPTCTAHMRSQAYLVYILLSRRGSSVWTLAVVETENCDVTTPPVDHSATRWNFL